MKTTVVKALLDTGASGCIIDKELSKYMTNKVIPQSKWVTAAGILHTSKTTEVRFRLSELDVDKTIKWTCHVADMSQLRYKIILGSDLLQTLGIDIRYSSKEIQWGSSILPLRTRDATFNPEKLHVSDELETTNTKSATTRMKQILDAKYEKMSPKQIAEACNHLTSTQKLKLEHLLKKFEHLFDGTLGTWKSSPYEIELQDGVKPYHAHPFPIPRIHESTLKMELEGLVKEGVV